MKLNTKQMEESKEEIKQTNGLKDEMTVSHPDFLKHKRLEGETDSQYKIRRLVNKMYIKSKKAGKQFWVAKTFGENKKGVTFEWKKYRGAVKKLKNQQTIK